MTRQKSTNGDLQICFPFISLFLFKLTARVRYIVNISRILPLICHRDRVAVFVQVHVGPSFLGGVEFVLVVGGNLGRTGIRGDVATMYRLFARVVALKVTELTFRRAHGHARCKFIRIKKKKRIDKYRGHRFWHNTWLHVARFQEENFV